MNQIQRAWLRVLQPVTYFINEKLATRSGLLGKLGRFFYIGQRQFGFHPINRMMIMGNQVIITFLGQALHRVSIIKGLTHNGYSTLRLLRHIAYFPIIYGLYILTAAPNAASGLTQRDEYTLENIAGAQPQSVPVNALNHRVSAHYTEIGDIYTMEMTKRYIKRKNQILEEREKASTYERKTRYARPGYVYVPQSSDVDEK